MKKERQAKILELVQWNEIETQEELQERLREVGCVVTQATISRDIKEMRLLKELSEHGTYKYSTGRKVSEEFAARFSGIFVESIQEVDYAMNTVVIKCYSGMANAACAAIDSMEWDGLVGTLAGDDTIFVLCRNEDSAILFTTNLERLFNA